MTMQDFFTHSSGSLRFSFSDCEPSMTRHDFWFIYHELPEYWNAEIENIDFIPQRGYTDTVICLIRLKKEG